MKLTFFWDIIITTSMYGFFGYTILEDERHKYYLCFEVAKAPKKYNIKSSYKP